jgi:alpha 1,6-mannosyltransferase
MKSDLLRYLVLNVEGGVYADIDTRAIKPIDKWVPSYLRNRVRLVAGLEFDRLDGNAWVGMQHYVQFGQWTFAGAPGHPVFRKLIDRAVEGVENLAKAHGVTIQELRPNKHTDVVNTTGPIAFTDMILEEITKVDPNITDMKQLSPMNENVVIGDMLLLPIDAFGMGQQHSASTNDGSTPKNALVEHLFWGHWTKGDQMGDDKKDDDQKGDDKKGDDKKDDDKKDDDKKDDDKKDDDKKDDDKKDDDKKDDDKKEDARADDKREEE